MNFSWLSKVAAILALLGLAGCTSIPGPGPSERVINGKHADLAGFSLIEIVAENVSDYRLLRNSDTAGTAGIPAAPRISLAPGDLLKVKISESREGGLFAPLASGGTSFDNVRVDDRGTISLPYAGRVKVAGLDTTRVEERLRAQAFGGGLRAAGLRRIAIGPGHQRAGQRRGQVAGPLLAARRARSP